jgi:hypothetical protein
MARASTRGAPRDPWRDAPTSELQDQVLPRWFVLTGLVMVPVAIAALVAAFVLGGPDEVPVAARRPPPGGGYTNAVGDLRTGGSEPAPLDEVPCPPLEGIRVAGTQVDRAALAEGLGVLCEDPPPGLGEFAAGGGVVRFAQFERTGVDSTAALDGSLILLNNRFSVTEPTWIAPLVVHDLAVLAGDPAAAETALAARQAEARACDALLDEPARSRACADAAALLALDDPLAALRAAGYR